MAEQQPMAIEAFAERVAKQVAEAGTESGRQTAINPTMIMAIIEMIMKLIEDCPTQAGFDKMTKTPGPFAKAWFVRRIARPISADYKLNNPVQLARLTIHESAISSEDVRKKIWDEVKTPDFSVV